MNISGQVLKDVLDLVLEATREHLVSLVKRKELQVVCLHEAAFHHVQDTTGCANDDVHTSFQNSDVVADNGATNASVNFDAAELTDRLNDVCDLH